MNFNKRLLLTCAVLGVTPYVRAKLSKPNILWIITDDHRADSLGCFNQATTGKTNSKLGYVSSPNVDQLAREGVLFTNAQCQSPVCSPSRNSMHFGKYPHHSGVYGFQKAHQKNPVYSLAIPQVMNKYGYQSSSFGKTGFYLFDKDGNKTWSDPGMYNPLISKNDLQATIYSDFWFNKPWKKINGKYKPLGKEEVFRFPDGRVERFWVTKTNSEFPANNQQERERIEKELNILRCYARSNKSLMIGGVSSNTTENTLDGSIVRSFKEYLSNPNKSYTSILGKKAPGPKTDKPLFVHLGFHFPHTPVLPSKEFRDLFKDKVYDIPAFNKAEIDLMPEALKGLHKKMNFSNMKPEHKQQAIRDYYAFCAMGDKLIGDAVTAFKDYCKKNNQEYTIVFVGGDHGWHLGEQGIEAKFSPWEKSTRGAAIVVSSDKKQYPAGVTTNDFVEYVDFAPTIYEAASIPTSAHPGLDGVSLRKSFMGEVPKRNYVIGEINHIGGDRAFIRTKNFAFSMKPRPFWQKPGNGFNPNDKIMWGLTAPRKDVEMSLYDLRIDGSERINVAYHKPYEKLADFFRQKLGNIVLGDGRLEVNWKKDNDFNISNFAPGAHDNKLHYSEGIIPASPQLPEKYIQLLNLSSEH